MPSAVIAVELPGREGKAGADVPEGIESPAAGLVEVGGGQGKGIQA
jgi:hypothetical protein